MVMVEEEHEEYIRDALTVSKGMNILSHDEWILDSSYYVHICRRKNILIHFKKIRQLLFL